MLCVISTVVCVFIVLCVLYAILVVLQYLFCTNIDIIFIVCIITAIVSNLYSFGVHIVFNTMLHVCLHYVLKYFVLFYKVINTIYHSYPHYVDNFTVNVDNFFGEQIIVIITIIV